MRTLRRVQASQRPATPGEQETLARWTGWGALPEVFDSRVERHAETRAELRELLSDAEYRDARRTVLNAHYTDPRIADALWTTLTDLGLDGGAVLEPGSGAGAFIGLAPQDTTVVGVELDGVTADIARTLYPSAIIRGESFADTPLADGSFDAAIGNVPFGNFALHDRLHNPGRHSIHNHFIVKSLDLTRPGGMVAVLSSRHTLDSVTPDARREIYDRADLITALRLPATAFRESAGTDVVTDVLVFRRRHDGEPAGDNTWLHTTPTTLTAGDGQEHDVPVNAWFAARPDLVLGTLSAATSAYGPTLTVTADPGVDPVDQLSTRLKQEVSSAAARGLTLTHDPNAEARKRDLATTAPVVAETGDARRFEGFITWDAEQEGFTAFRAGLQVPVDTPKAHVAPLRALLEIRDVQLALLDAEAATPDDTAEIRQLRARLNVAYDAYADKYGPINHVTVSVQKALDSNGDPIVSRRKRPVMRTFDLDPFAGAVRGLELYDETTATATKAAIFRERVVNRTQAIAKADTPADALAIVMDQTATVDLDEVARLLDTDKVDARRQLGDLVFDDPATNTLVPRAAYLSGNVRHALKVAEEAAQDRPELLTNVRALREVIPRDLTPAEIKAQLGAVWIPASDVQDFLRATLKSRSVTVDHPGGAQWVVRGGERYSVAATATWGTDRINAFVIAERLMQQKPIVVNDTITDADGRERRVPNPGATAAAQDKAEQLQERFSEWIWQDPDRAQRLTEIYNEKFNAIALRDYTEDGKRLTLPGLVAGWVPHEHQRAAVARMIAEPSVGLYHAVGAGKTAEMVMGSMELRRLGLVDKPCVIVPNHMLEQVTREWMQLYPRARVLAAGTEDLKGTGRQRFIGRAATGDWDAVIMTHRAFESLPVAKSTEVDYIETEVENLRASRERAKQGGMTDHTVKSIERAVSKAEERLKHRLDRPRDVGLTFEQTGIDYLVVDELHLFKNLGLASNIPDANKEGAKRANDLDMKLGYLRKHAGQDGRVITGATATPIANSVAEAYVMQKYLRPDLLTDAGITDFDSWAATFGSITTDLELRPEGGWKPKTRFARFDNLPELLRMWHVTADVKTARDLDLPVPAIAPDEKGQRVPTTAVIPASPELVDFMDSLADRAEALRAGGAPRGKGADNMLVVSNDGRKAALDLRMLDRSQTAPVASTPSKVDAVAERVHQAWLNNRDNQYLIDPDGDATQYHPARGGLQIVFCDLGTPGSKPEDTWSFYGELRRQLTERGMDPARIKFVQDANNDQKKARLFQACRTGQVDVIVGSTETMGVGTNIQARAVALHHVDCPWRPADVEQREGRLLRQGNHNPEVQIYRYVTENSFDAFSWQTVERKQRFIDQMMHGSLDDRGAEDLDAGKTLSFSEVKALASGNPLLMERAEAEQRLTKLERLERAHARNQQFRRSTIETMTRTEAELSDQVPRIEALIAGRTDTSGEKFRATVNGATLTERADAAAALAERVSTALVNNPYSHRFPVDPITIGTTPFTIEIAQGNDTLHAIFTPENLPERAVTVDAEAVTNGGIGPITRLENRVAGLDAILDETRHRRDTARTEREEAARDLGTPFPRADDLKEARAELTRIDKLLSEMNKEKDPAPEPATHDPDFRASREKLRERVERAKAEARRSVEDTRRDRERPHREPTQDSPHL